MVDGSLWPLGRFHSLGIFGVDEVRDGIIISPFWRLLLFSCTFLSFGSLSISTIGFSMDFIAFFL